MKRVLMLATTAAMIEQFNKNNIELLNDMGYVVDIAGNFREGNPISEERLEAFRWWITERGGEYYHIPAVRKPMALGANIKAYRMVVGLLKKYTYSFVHVHTPIGSIIGRLAAHKTHTKIIYTAHGFHFYKGAPFKNWLLYYPAEWLCSWWTDVLITINQEDYQLAKKHMHARRTEYVPGVGVDTEKFAACCVDREKKREELGISKDDILLISVGELNQNKNQSVVIRAMAELQNANVHYLLCGQGELLQELRQLAEELKVQKQVHFLGFRNDVLELYRCSDVFVFPSKREGLSVALMEAMASGLPVICSKIRGNVDLVENEKGGLYIQPESVKEMASAIRRMCTDVRFRRACSEYNFSAIKKYDTPNCNQIMKEIYQR